MRAYLAEGLPCREAASLPLASSSFILVGLSPEATVKRYSRIGGM